MNESVKTYLMTQGLYEFTLGGYPSKDNNNIPYNVFYGVRQKIGKKCVINKMNKANKDYRNLVTPVYYIRLQTVVKCIYQSLKKCI
jgi:hypothetical protein